MNGPLTPESVASSNAPHVAHSGARHRIAILAVVACFAMATSGVLALGFRRINEILTEVIDGG